MMSEDTNQAWGEASAMANRGEEGTVREEQEQGQEGEQEDGVVVAETVVDEVGDAAPRESEQEGDARPGATAAASTSPPTQHPAQVPSGSSSSSSLLSPSKHTSTVHPAAVGEAVEPAPAAFQENELADRRHTVFERDEVTQRAGAGAASTDTSTSQQQQNGQPEASSTAHVQLRVKKEMSTASLGDIGDGDDDDDDSDDYHLGDPLSPKPYPDLESLYGDMHDEMVPHCYMAHGCRKSPKKIHAVLQYRLPKAAKAEAERKRILEIERKGYQYFERLTHEEFQSMKEWEQNAHRRRFFELELTQEDIKPRIKQLQRLADKGVATPEQLKDLKRKKKHFEHCAVVLEKELKVTDGDNDIVFVKVHVPYSVLLKEAENAHLKMQLRTDLGRPSETHKEHSSKFFLNNVLSVGVDQFKRHLKLEKKLDPDVFRLVFTVKNKDNFVNSDDPEKFFSQAQQLYLTDRVLKTRRYAPRASRPENDAFQVGYERLIHKGAYDKAFPLHDSEINGMGQGMRQQLHDNWAQWRNWYRHQPIEDVREYFGERVAFYFLWLGFYTKWLVVPAIVGVIVFFVGLSLTDSVDVQELCNSTKTMCGACSTCETWTLSDACEAYKYSYLIDNHATVVYAVFMCIWATLLLEFWKRRQIRAAWSWGVNHYKKLEPQRPEFTGTITLDQTTGLLQTFFPQSRRYRRYAANAVLIAVMLIIVILIVLGLAVLRVILRQSLYERSTGSGGAREHQLNDLIPVFVSSVILVIVIVGLSRVYSRLAIRLTDWENHERASDYEHALAIKLFLFQFVNNFCSMIYVAFFKGTFNNRPGREARIFGYSQDGCPEYGCLLELTILLGVVMIGRQFAGNVREVVLPEMWAFVNRRSAAFRQRKGSINKHTVPWEVQSVMAGAGATGLLEEYLELMLQFGFITLFVTAFPLAPFFALVNNVFERHIDALKKTKVHRRSFAEAASSIGVWLKILNALSALAVIFNGFAIAITSNYIPRLVYSEIEGSLEGFIDVRYSLDPDVGCHYRGFEEDGEPTRLYYHVFMARLAFVIVFEHVVFGIKFLVMTLIGDEPSDVTRKERSEQHLFQRILDRQLKHVHDDAAANVA